MGTGEAIFSISDSSRPDLSMSLLKTFWKLVTANAEFLPTSWGLWVGNIFFTWWRYISIGKQHHRLVSCPMWLGQADLASTQAKVPWLNRSNCSIWVLEDNWLTTFVTLWSDQHNFISTNVSVRFVCLREEKVKYPTTHIDSCIQWYIKSQGIRIYKCNGRWCYRTLTSEKYPELFQFVSVWTQAGLLIVSWPELSNRAW